MDLPKDKLKFLIVSRWFFPGDQGGVSMHNGYLVRALMNDLDVQVLSLKNSVNLDFYKQLNIPFHFIEEPKLTFLRKVCYFSWMKNGLRAYYDWLISKRIANEVERIQPDVVEFMDIHSEGYLYLKRNSKSRTKVVIRSHTPWALLRNTYSAEERAGADSWNAVGREKFCFTRCDAITTPSHSLKHQLIELFDLPSVKITAIPNVLDTGHFSPVTTLKDNEEYTILHVGRFQKAKGVETLIKAFIKLSEKYNWIRLINVGKPMGDSYKKCKALLHEAGLDAKVIFTGFVSYDELPTWYAKSDLVVVAPEIYESFSYTLAQAMACGKTVLSSDSGGMPETIDDSDYVFTRGDVEALVERIEMVLKNKNSNTVNRNRQKAETRFSISVLSSTFVEFYKSIL